MATTLAERMNKFSGSPTSALIAKVAELKRQGKDIISLNVGEPDFGTPDYIKVAGMKAIADNFTKYTPGNGILELRQEIVKKLREDNGVEYALNEVTTAVGAKQAIASAMMVLAGPGDEVLLPIPCWVSYTEMIRLAGATPVFVPVREDNYELDLDAIEKAITPRTKAIVICTPNNPTGAVYSEESLRKLAALAVEHDFFVVADEIYEKLVYDGAEHFSVASISQEVRDRTVTVNGFSKAYAMTGWRIGYICGPKEVISQMPKLQENVVSCISAFIQGGGGRGGGSTEDKKRSDECVKAMRDEYRRRRDVFVDGLNSIDKISVVKPKGAFYLFVNIKETGLTSEEFCIRLLEEQNVLTSPGSAFGAMGEGYIRISYATSMDTIKEGLKRIRAFVAAL